MRAKKIIYFLLGALVLSSLFIVGFTLSHSASVAAQPSASPHPSDESLGAADLLKARLDTYSKEADNLQKLLTLLVTLTTIYTVALAFSAYKSVQDNLRESEKGIERLNGTIERANDAIPKQIEELQQQTLYTRRIAVATAISQFPLKEENYQEVQKTFVETLLGMRERYPTDPILNQQIAQLYIALARYRDAEQVMTTFIERKREKGERSDNAIADAYYDRACFRALQWTAATDDEQKSLKAGIGHDLGRAFRLNYTLREPAKDDKQLRNVAGESWFQALIR